MVQLKMNNCIVYAAAKSVAAGINRNITTKL